MLRKEFDARMRVLEGEVEGEKAVTRYIFDQARRRGDNLAAVKTELEAIKMRLDHRDGEFVLLKSALNSHTALLLNVLTQDVGQLRLAMGDMRRDIRTMRTDIDTVRAEMGPMRTDIAAIRAAVAPREPPPGA
jgi:chromosome segregation ATPase